MNALTLSSPTMSKKEVQALALQLSESVDNPIEVYAKLQKIKTLAEATMSELKAQALDSIGDEGVPVLNGTLTWQGGGVAYSGGASFGHYQAWQEAKDKVKEIEGQMKLVAKQPHTVIVDEDGEQVPAALATTRKPFLKYNW